MNWVFFLFTGFFMQKRILLLGFFLWFSTKGIGQTLRYDVFVNGDPVGTIVAKHYQEGDSDIYSVVSDVTYTFIKTFHFKYTYEAVYKNHVLIQSSYTHHTNGDLKEYAKVNWDGQQYEYEKDDEKWKGALHPFSVSMTRLYFQKPNGLHKVFSERFLDFVEVEPKSDGRYVMELPEGSDNYYTYGPDGFCQQVEADHPLISFMFKRH